MQPWPDNAFLKGYYEPLTMECTAPDLVIEGETDFQAEAERLSRQLM